MLKSAVLSLVFLFLAVVAAGYTGSFFDATWAPWCLAIGTCGALMSMMALGAIRRGKIAPVLRWVFAGMFLFCAGCFCVALAIPPNEGAGGPLLFNFPLRSTIVLLGVAIVPILVMPFAWALTFDSSMLSEDDLVRLREAQTEMARANMGSK
ncbi:MAG TPA: hypothetical protein VGQ30_11955 [Gemmatimonadaceae bacterium]|nr:hypothetical protein [Gemmatimonadaceae bacterium]